VLVQGSIVCCMIEGSIELGDMAGVQDTNVSDDVSTTDRAVLLRHTCACKALHVPLAFSALLARKDLSPPPPPPAPPPLLPGGRLELRVL
jgi:hypothetical protein